MQFQFKLKKYLQKKAENKWQLIRTPPQNYYNTFIIVPAKAELDNLPILLQSLSRQDPQYLKKCLTILSSSE